MKGASKVIRFFVAQWNILFKPSRIAQLLIALEDSVFVETITDINDVTIVPEYRKIVNESMNIKKLN